MFGSAVRISPIANLQWETINLIQAGVTGFRTGEKPVNLDIGLTFLFRTSILERGLPYHQSLPHSPEKVTEAESSIASDIRANIATL